MRARDILRLAPEQRNRLLADAAEAVASCCQSVAAAEENVVDDWEDICDPAPRGAWRGFQTEGDRRAARCEGQMLLFVKGSWTAAAAGGRCRRAQ